MNFLVIGGDGFIGSHICRHLVRHGHRVSMFGPAFRKFLIEDIDAQLEKMTGDITDRSATLHAIEQTKPDVVVHLAAYGAGDQGVARSAQQSPQKAMDVNVLGFFNLLEAAKTCPTVHKVIWSGSSTVFGPAEDYAAETVTETSPVNPRLFYGLTKAINELTGQYYHRQYDLEVIGIRLPLIYGPGRWYKGAGAALVDIFEKSHAPEPVKITGGAEPIDLMYVKDIPALIEQIALTSKRLDAVYHVKSHTTTLKEMCATVKRLIPDYRLEFEEEPSHLVYPLMETAKIKHDLGYEPQYTLEAACTDYLKSLGRIKHD